MKLLGLLAGSAVLGVMLWGGVAIGQGKPTCDERGKVATQELVEGQVVKVDSAQGRVSVREADGKVHEFQASQDTLKALLSRPSSVLSSRRVFHGPPRHLPCAPRTAGNGIDS